MNIFKWLFSRKYRIFKKKVRDVDVSLWEYEFKVSKSRQVREGVRQDRDRAVENVKRLEVIMKEEKDAQKLALYVVEKDKHADNAKRYEAQMKMIDEQVSGTPANDEGPGQEGIIGIMASLTELKKMYVDYLTKI